MQGLLEIFPGGLHGFVSGPACPGRGAARPRHLGWAEPRRPRGAADQGPFPVSGGPGSAVHHERTPTQSPTSNGFRCTASGTPAPLANSALGAQQPAALAFPAALLLGLALVVELLAAGERKLDLGAPFFVEIELERHERHALALDRP